MLKLKPADEAAQLHRLIDHLAVALPRLDRLRVTARQNLIDARAAQVALEDAIEVLRTWPHEDLDGP